VLLEDCNFFDELDDYRIYKTDGSQRLYAFCFVHTRVVKYES